MYIFILNSALLGIGLAMDAFSVSLANGLNEPGMRKRRMAAIAGVYAWFQFMMPMAGWFCVRRLVAYFRIFEHWIPWIALILLFGYLLARRTRLDFRGAPWYVYFVGIFGIAIVASSSWCTLKVGASVMLAISTAGQILSSQLIDQFGLFGMPVQKFRAKQLPGYVLLAAGVALVVLGT